MHANQRSRNKPEDLPDEHDEDIRRRPRPRRNPHPGDGWGVMKWIAFAGGAICVVIAISAPPVQAATWAGLACFSAIGSRLAQAEQHRYPL